MSGDTAESPDDPADQKLEFDPSYSSTAPVDWELEIAGSLHENADRESHIEEEPRRIHASQIAQCPRQATRSKLGLGTPDTDSLGKARVGALIHEWLEEVAPVSCLLREEEFEKEYADPSGNGSVVVTGAVDAYDPANEIVYDYKTRGGWYRFDPPTERHVDQLMVYMGLTGATKGRLVYISRKDLSVNVWPEDRTIKFNEEHFETLLDKARRIRDAIRDEGPISSVEQIPFQPCDCWLCRMN